ncbi:hypothetical protein CAPTEDRAFT_135268 [Capitella teleta]|uniref:Fatty acid hydroxylase domain-containing protein n=1 Tax=Capitella teleta TaxID=283909 RepID=R7UP91_CAPTE|nr:hypothetical protein CAPTEDRAFT_135268 [Capitella teleta]|eukprot:ELU05216.1 hypothetical protein CAPTEDRAFT_135268 [Capitella teleta]
MQWVDAGVKGILIETLEYCAPLLIADSLKAKSYPGVDPQDFADKSGGWWQVERALPKEAPSLAQVAYQLIGAFVLFDAGFHHIHFMLHKNQWLYKHLHAYHHDHEHVHARVTNQLHVLERLGHIVAANYALKAMGAHPFTRTLFVPLFVGWLMYNHCGYEFPWMLEFVVPWGIVSGSRQHRDHHVYGGGNYQPFFTYIDRFMEWQKENRLFEGFKGSATGLKLQ